MRFFKKKYHNQTDKQLLAALIEGQQGAFDELYQRYEGRMRGYFYQMLGSSEKIDDITQDLFLKIIEKATLFNPKYSFSTWIYTIASNMCKNIYRSQKYQRIDYIENLEDIELEANDIVRIEHLDQIQFDADLEKVLQILKVGHRDCFVLRFREELSIREIATILSIPEGTVKSRLFYVLRQLAQELEMYRTIF